MPSVAKTITEQKPMRVGIIGAGAIAFGVAAFLLQAGHETSLWSPSGRSTTDLASGHTLVTTGEVCGNFSPRIASSCEDCISGADVIVFALPAYGHKFAFDAAAAHIQEGQTLVISSHLSFGALYLSKLLAERGVCAPIVVWGTSMLTARKRGPSQVHVGSLRGKVDMATVPASAIEEGHAVCSRLFGERFVRREGLLAIALSNLNPQNHLGIALLNLTRMDLGEEWNQSGSITPTVARFIEALDLERLAIAKAFGLHVKTVQDHYSQTCKVPNGSVYEANQERHRRGLGVAGPRTVDSRYVLEDAPFGLVPMILLGRLTGNKATLHKSGLAILSAAYGRNFAAENDLLSELDFRDLSVANLERIACDGYGAVSSRTPVTQ